MNETAVSILNPSPRPNPRPDTARLIDAFLSGRNPRTLAAYRQDLEDFRTFTETNTLDEAARRLLGAGMVARTGLHWPTSWRWWTEGLRLIRSIDAWPLSGHS
jgi:hypothetical protein